MYHSFFIHPSIDGHLGYFQVLAITTLNFKQICFVLLGRDPLK